MTDPLSVSASISGLVTLADIVFRRTYKYVKAVKKGAKEISALSAEIGALYGILSNLQLVSRQLEDEAFEATTRIHHIHSCYETLEHVKAILDRDDTSSLRDEPIEALKRKMRWPFTSSEVKDLLAEIERHKSTLGLALNVDCMSGLLQALSKQNDFHDAIEGIKTELKEKHEAETRIALSKERQEILKSFAKVDSRSNHEMSRKLRSPGTGLWLTEGEEFRQWLKTKNAQLWLYGIPGAGKTILAASVIEEALQTSSPSTAVAYFYCDYKDSATQDLSNILGLLAQQFAKQDEESFATLRKFYETHNPEHRPDFRYDSEALWNLVRAVTSVFDCAMIIVDGLDECGTNAPLVVDSLTTLQDDEASTIKTLFLSRDEIEIRERLENYAKVSIAATSSDLRLYVAAEIELRTRNKKLRIKDQSIKEHILERLVEGAEGMFRWVTCQMDYLCELPNDAARRKALSSLPPDLNSTYERILSRVNQKNTETQRLVRRALRWIANANREVYVAIEVFSVEALCEAVSINFGDTRRNSQAIPDEFEILRSCSSLVRRSADGRKLELAHFTVKEFLQQIEPRRDIAIGAYRIDRESDELILAKVCFTYLNFEDFDQGGLFSQHEVIRRFQKYPFRRYAVVGWSGAAHDNLNNHELFALMQKLFSPSKPNTFISWMHDWTAHVFGGLLNNEEKMHILSSCFAESTALHWVAMLRLAKMCNWLIRSGCDVNRKSSLGTPLYFAVLGWFVLCYKWEDAKVVLTNGICSNPGERGTTVLDTLDVLLEAGADPDYYYDAGPRRFSPLSLALYSPKWNVVQRLLDSGGTLDSTCLEALEDGSKLEIIHIVVEHTIKHKVPEDIHSRLLQLALKAEASNVTRLIQKDEDLPLHGAHYNQVLRAAAEHGQLEVVKCLLEDKRLDVDAADESTGLTALHFAARTNQLGVMQILMDRGADSTKSDRMGRTALHHAVQGREVCCLEFLLHHSANTSLRDLKGMTVWHLAAQEGDVQALSLLLSRPGDALAAIGLKDNDGRTPFLYASANGSKEAMRLLLSAGSSVAETATDGSSTLHYAAKSGSLEAVKFLIQHAVDPCASAHDSSSAIHDAVKGNSEKLAEIVQLLLDYGVDPCKARNDGHTPIHDIVDLIKDKSNGPDESEVDDLFSASRELLKKLLEKSRSASHLRLGSELLYLACLDSGPIAHETILGLLEFGLDCNLPSANGESALMAAAKSGNDAIFSALLLHGADPCIDILGLSALHCACFNGHRNILVHLKGTSIDWNSKATTQILGARRTQVTALHIAAQCGNTSVLEYLLDEHLMSKIDVRTDAGETPLAMAVHSREPRNVSLLLSNSADTTIIDEFGQSAIHWAARFGNEEIIRLFITHGSDMGLLNRMGLTPEWEARKHGHETLATEIMDYVKRQNGEDATPTSQRAGRNHRLSESLKVAIDIEDLELCKRLVEDGADLNSGFEWCMGCTPLLYSLRKGQVAIAEYLVSQGASTAGSTCEAYSTRGFTSFHHAAVLGSAELLRLLLEKAPSDIYVNQDPIHPIHLAVLNDKAECVKLILDHASQGKIVLVSNPSVCSRNINTGKGLPVSDQMSTLRDALDRIVNKQVGADMLRWTWQATPEQAFPEALETARPLHIAATKGLSRIASMLLDYGASVDAADRTLATPLHYAAANGQIVMINLFLVSGANPNAVNSGLENPCMSAVRNGDVDSVRTLLNSGADLQLRNRYGQTALHLAAGSGSKDVFVFVMTTTTGYDLGAEDTWGRSVLYEIVWNRLAFPMSFVLGLAPPARAYESGLDNILNTAIESRSTTDVRYLIRRLPRGLLPKLLSRRSPDGWTPLQLAIVLSKVDVMIVLLDAGAQLELEGSEYGTPLMAACATGRLAAVKVLVARGARTSYMKDGQRYSAFLAAKYHPEVRRWLLVGRFLEGPKLLTYSAER